MSKEISISPELNDIFLAVNREVTWLHTVWDLYIQLYGTSDEHMNIMNSSAPLFFSIVQNILFEELAITVNRLIEKHNTFGKDNACLEQIIEKIDSNTHPSLIDILRVKLKDIRSKSSTFRMWRNKRIAHSDLVTILEKNSEILPGITRREVQELISKISEFMNEFSIPLLGGAQGYMPFLTGYGDGNELIRLLKIALEKQRYRE